MPVTATELRANIYKLLDHVVATGEAIEVERRGVVLRIAPRDSRSLEELFPPKPRLIQGDSAALAELDWSSSRSAEGDV